MNGVASAPVTEAPSRPLAKPPVRKLAKDLGVDLTTVTPTGPEGIITREDVHAATAPVAEEPPRSPRRHRWPPRRRRWAGRPGSP